MRFMWWAPCALMGLALVAGCEQTETNDPQPEADAEPAIDGTVDGQPVDQGDMPDAAPDPEPDAGGDPCPAACQRLAVCAVEACEDISADDSAAIGEACGALCAETPTVASVLNGADCATAVEFGTDRLPDLFAGDCGTMSVDPDPLPDNIPCPWDCQDGEQCLGGYCVRDDGSCDTDYHCRPDREVCGDDGRCEPAQFAACRGVNDCADGFECRYFDPDPFADGTCIRPCGGNPDCPFGEECNVAFGNLCYPAICGPGTGNGTLYVDCTVGPNPGTCYPLTVGQAQQGQPGFCSEAGTAEVGAPCDNQADERTPESAALRCAPGALCFGDPDDPRNPYDMENEQGECARLCDPRDPDATCIEGEFCIDFSSADDPSTQFNEQNYIGICYRTDCDALDPAACPEDGEACRVLSAANREGRCEPTGEVPIGEACSDEQPCAGTAICGANNRDQQVCIGMCDPDAPDCPADQFCYREDNWTVGFCIYPVEGQPLPDMGPPPEPDMGPPAPEMDMGPPPEPDMGPPAPEMDMGPPPEPDMGPEGR